MLQVDRPGNPGARPSRHSIATGLLLVLGLLPGALDLWTYQIRLKPHYGFALLVPAAVLWVLRLRRSELRASGPGDRALSAAMYATAFAILTMSDLFLSAALWAGALLVGVAALLHDASGSRGLRIGAPVLGLVALSVPLPLGVDHWVIFRLQLLASGVAERVLDGILGLEVLRDGNALHLEDVTLFVADACSGVQSLLAVLAVLLFMLAMNPRGLLETAFLVIAATIVDLTLNIGRIVIVAWAASMAPGAGAALQEGVGHLTLGVAGFLLLLVLLASFDALLSVGRYVALTAVPRWLARLLDPHDLMPSTPGRHDHPYGGPTMLLGTWLARGEDSIRMPGEEAASEPPRRSRSPLVGSARFRAAMAGVIFVIGMVQAALIGLDDPVGRVHPRLASLDRLFPDLWHGWALEKSEHLEKGDETMEARRSWIWRFSQGQDHLVVFLHYPYGTWHPFEHCYEGNGHTIRGKQGGRVPGKEGTSGFPYVTFLADRENRHLQALYTCFDPAREVTPIPMTSDSRTLDLMERLHARWEDVRQRLSVAGLLVVAERSSQELDDPDGTDRELTRLLEDARDRIIAVTRSRRGGPGRGSS